MHEKQMSLEKLCVRRCLTVACTEVITTCPPIWRVLEIQVTGIQARAQIYVVVDPRMHVAKMDDRTSYKIWRR